MTIVVVSDIEKEMMSLRGKFISLNVEIEIMAGEFAICE